MVITCQKNKVLEPPFIQLATSAETQCQLPKGNFSTPERSRDLIYPASKMFIKSLISQQMKYLLSVKPRHAPLGNGRESPVCIRSVSRKVSLPSLQSIPPKVSFRKTGNEGLRGQGRKGGWEHTP